jgi:hypothetical protein
MRRLTHFALIGGLLMLVLLSGCSQPPEATISHAGLLTYNQPVGNILTGPDQEHHWVFAAQPSDSIRIELAYTGSTPSLVLRGPDNGDIPLVYQLDSQRITTESLTLPAEGMYAVILDLPMAGTADYTLSVQQANLPAAQPITPTSAAQSPTLPAAATITPAILGATETHPPPIVGSGSQLEPYLVIQGLLERPNAIERYTILGIAGEAITIGATTVPGSSVNPRITVYAPSGDVLAEVDDSLGSLNAIALNLSLPSTGAYIVFVRDSDGQGTGLYELSFGYGPTMRNAEQDPPLPETVLNGSLDQPAIRDVWPLDLNVGDIISAAVAVDDASPLDPVLSLIGPDGAVIYSDDNSGGGRNAALREVIATQSGRFYLAVAPSQSMMQGSYTLFWQYNAQAP